MYDRGDRGADTEVRQTDRRTNRQKKLGMNDRQRDKEIAMQTDMKRACIQYTYIQ